MNRSFWLSALVGSLALVFTSACSKTNGMVLVTANADIGTTANFYIDQYESSLKETTKTVSGTKTTVTIAQSKNAILPANGVNFSEAVAYCKAADKRICTTKEWLTACAGPENKGASVQLAPTTPVSIDTLCYVNRAPATGVSPTLIKTGSSVTCRTAGINIYDLIGNVSEWAADGTDGFAMGPHVGSKVIDSKCSYFVKTDTNNDGIEETALDPTVNSEYVGFRCCLSVTAS